MASESAAAPGLLTRTAAATGEAFFGIAGTVGGMGVLLGRILVRIVAVPPRVDGRS